ncbi:SusC/RagA family TonB-linked outer membrane protein [Hymenobacter crusticola]|uniref:SusC/RagA family TonB-linked outer membrane protein n=1 Tax=Hymenobacter crusticola TaxID=1770526 RepID=UPI000A3824A9|nr:TonB-dependent receptor [Hymenobacter crusticola]
MQNQLPKKRSGRRRQLAGAVLALSCAGQAQAQEASALNLAFNNAKLPQVFQAIEAKSGYHFAYAEALTRLPGTYSLNVQNANIDGVLADLEAQGNVKFRRDHQTISVQVRPEVKKPAKVAERPINGKVKDKSGQSLPGVTVILKGTNNGTVTDTEGNFQLTVTEPEQAVLVFSFVGYETRELRVADQASFDITLSDAAQGLDEVVVIGYGTAKRENITTAVSTLPNPEKIAQRPISNVQDMLQGNVAGVTVLQNGGDPSATARVVIRGAGTLNSESPLYVVDGMPYYGGPLNPNDIASITVLKDAAAAAIYGAQAASGVIVVTTKSGKSGTPRVTIDTYQGWQTAYKLPHALNAAEQAAAYNQAADNAGVGRPAAHDATKNPWGQVTRTDWMDEIFRTGSIYNLNATVSGGNDRGRFLTSFGYHNREGLLLNTNLKRYTLRLKSDYDISPKITVGQNVYINQTNARGTNTSNSYSGSIINAIYMPSAAPVRNPDGTFGGVTPMAPAPEFQFAGAYGDVYNPVALLKRPTVSSPLLNLNGIGYVEYNPLANLKFRSSFSLDLQRESYKRFDPRIPEPGRANTMNYLTQNQTDRNRWIWDNQVSYQKSLGKHFFDLTAVYSAQRTNYEYYSVQAQNFDREDDWYQYIGNAKEFVQRPGSDVWQDALTSAIGRLTYSYADRYFLTASLRRDQTSRLSRFNSDYFPAVSGAWKISSEPFFNLKGVQTLKLRGSWGQIGNIQSVAYYAYNVPLVTGQSYLGSTPAYSTGYYINKQSNPDLKWERSETFDAGLDLGLLDNRLTITADYFQKYTRGLILAVAPNTSAGVGEGATSNVGTVLNKGFELGVGYNDQVGDLRYQVNGNVATLKNRVEDLDGYGSDFIQHTDNVRTQLYPYRSAPGQPLYAYYLIPNEGLFRSAQEVAAYTNGEGKLIQPNAKPGDLKFRDVNGDGKIDDNDRVYRGNAMPKLTYGLTLGGQWKGFDISMFWQGVSGVKLFNGYKFSTYNAGLQGYNLDSRVLGTWTPENPNADIPRLSTADANQNFSRVSDWYLENGSYLRLKNLTIGYTLPPSFTDRVRTGTSLRFYATVENLATFTKYSGLDPEVGGIGLDVGSYPLPRTFTVGLNLGL